MLSTIIFFAYREGTPDSLQTKLKSIPGHKDFVFRTIIGVYLRMPEQWSPSRSRRLWQRRRGIRPTPTNRDWSMMNYHNWWSSCLWMKLTATQGLVFTWRNPLATPVDAWGCRKKKEHRGPCQFNSKKTYDLLSYLIYLIPLFQVWETFTISPFKNSSSCSLRMLRGITHGHPWSWYLSLISVSDLF